jgi:hypothetical protein
MNMKDHILAALREQLESWEQLLAKLSDEQIAAPRFDLGWSIKDVMSHLWAWQQISIAWMQGGINHREPEYPRWIVESVGNWEKDSDQVNALTFKHNHQNPWPEIYQMWNNGLLQFLELGNRIPEGELLDGDRFPWLKGYNLAYVLIASYEHHQEHLEKMRDWLDNQ